METQSAFGRRLKLARSRAGLTQDELAKKAGLHRPDIAGLETNRRPCGRDVAERIAVALGLNVRRRRDLIESAIGTTVSGRDLAFRTYLERQLGSAVIGVEIESPFVYAHHNGMIVTTTDGRRWVVQLKIQELKEGKSAKLKSEGEK